jgi:predicted CXXCH cytochrome family protein
MGRFRRTLGPTVTIAGAAGIWLAVVISVGAAASPQKGGPPVAKAAAAPSAPAAQTVPGADQYVGEEKCLECHEDQKKGYKGSPHARSHNPRTPAGNYSCESCHGPGKAHVDADGDGHIKNPKTMTSREVGELCTTCHAVHDYKSEKAQLKKENVQETCVQCHRREVNKVHRSSHMPVNEGKMECTTCHNPHGSQNVKMLREGNSINEACASCHTEKRGPFLWEHAVGRESCITCHDPHGSNNERMLVAKLPMLCQRCHIHSRHPATIYDTTQVTNSSNRVVGRACVNCHQMLHGSNHPTSGKVFLR